MKNYFIQAIINRGIDKTLIDKISKEIPKEITIFYSSQYIRLAEKVKKSLETEHNIHSFAQVLGCSKPKLNSSIKSILLISDGKFHGESLAYETKLPVFILNAFGFSQISEDKIKQFQQSKKSSYVNFLNSKKVGILISTKIGQQRMAQTLNSNKFKDKEKYFFLTNNINTFEFENFPQIQSWVNTACPRIDLNSKKIVNINDLN